MRTNIVKAHTKAVGLAVLAIALLGVAAVMAFGTPQSAKSPIASDRPFADAPTSAGPAGESPMDDSKVATGSVPAPDPTSPLAIEIPGCVCHSDDPELVAQHEQYRMNQCFGCHTGGMPEMGQ